MALIKTAARPERRKQPSQMSIGLTVGITYLISNFLKSIGSAMLHTEGCTLCVGKTKIVSTPYKHEIKNISDVIAMFVTLCNDRWSL